MNTPRQSARTARRAWLQRLAALSLAPLGARLATAGTDADAPVVATVAQNAAAAPPVLDPAPTDDPVAGLGVAPRTLRFPRDFGAHPETLIEWWYLTGALQETGAGGRRFGFQITFFRSRTEVPADAPSRFAARQLVFAHAAVSDIAAARLHHDQRVARIGFGIADAARADTAVNLRDWWLRRDPATPGDGPLADLAGASRYRMRAAGSGFEFELDARSTQPLLLQGEAGYSRKGPGDAEASHYYSQPQLALDGRLRVGDDRLAVQGRGWLDHEWSDALLSPEAVGWDWIGMNLDDGTAFTAFRLRRADGSAWFHGGSWRPPGGAVRAFADVDLRFTPGRRWRSPATQAEYPVAWTIDTPVGRFAVEALFDAQELDSRGSVGAVYWEGLSRLRDGVGREVGRGYLEMTGYASRLRIG